jgi:hypothetical protein
MTADDAAEKVENEADEEENEIGEVLNSRILRSVGQQGLKWLADFFRCPVEFDFTPYISPSFSAIFTLSGVIGSREYSSPFGAPGIVLCLDQSTGICDPPRTARPSRTAQDPRLSCCG